MWVHHNNVTLPDSRYFFRVTSRSGAGRDGKESWNCRVFSRSDVNLDTILNHPIFVMFFLNERLVAGR